MVRAVYSANDILSPISFGLYNYMCIDEEESIKNMTKILRNSMNAMNKKLEKVGLKIINIKPYRPFSYNFEDDDFDFVIELTDKEKLRRYVKKNEDEIHLMMYGNISRDGYISTTNRSVANEYEDMKKKDYTPDIIVVRHIFKKLNVAQFTQDDIIECMVLEQE